MKNLKRVLALIMVVALVFSLSVSALAFTDDAAITNEQAVNVLSELGVIKGYPDGSFRPTDPVTRAEMAKMITVILNKGVDDPAQFESGTTDLTDISWNWGKSYITYCYILNIIAGYGDGTFRPDDEVTVQEAAKMILVSLGFDVDQEGLEGVNWAVNANSLANQYDLYTGVDQSVNVSATRDTIAQMLYNMLKANTVQYNVNIYTGISTLIKNDETAIEKYFDCEILNGIIVANEYAALWGGVPLMEGRTEVLFYDKDATANGMFDIADINYVNGVFNNYISDILKISTGKDELGMWVSLIRNRTTKNVIGQVMLENDMMTVVEGGDGNFVDAIKAAGLRLSDGRYSLFVNGEIFKWESSNGYYNLPDDVNHPLNSNAYTRTSGTINGTESYGVYNAYLGTVLESIFGTEYKDMNGMTFRAIELNGDNYVDAIFVETETLTQITKVETKGGAKEYTFAGLNMNYTGTGTAVAPDATWSNYAASSVKEAYIVTDATLAVDDYVLVTQVNETYNVSKVEFEELTVSIKNTDKKTLTLKDKDSNSTAYNLSHIPVVNYVVDNSEIYTNDKKTGTLALLADTVTGDTYTFGFDSAGNVVMAKKGETKTDYALLNGMATTYGTSYTAQLFTEDGTTIEGGVDDFSVNRTVDSVNVAQDPIGGRSVPSNYLASTSGTSASAAPLLVSYAKDGSKYDITGRVNVYGGTDTVGSISDDNIYNGKTSITINGQEYRVTSNTVFFYRVENDTTGKVNYYAYTDYNKAPTFSAARTVSGATVSVDVQAALVSEDYAYNGSVLSATPRLAAVYVSAMKSAISDPAGKDYIYVSRRDSTNYDTKRTSVTGITIDENGKVTEVSDFVFDDAYESVIEGKLYTYTSTSEAGVYKRNEDPEATHTVTGIPTTSYVSYTGSPGDSTYREANTNIYNKIGTGVKYEKLSGNFTNNSNLKTNDVIYAVNMPDSTIAAFIIRVDRDSTTTPTTPDPDAGALSFNPIMVGTNAARVSVDQSTMKISVLTWAGNNGVITVPVADLGVTTGYSIATSSATNSGATWAFLGSGSTLAVTGSGIAPTQCYVGVFNNLGERVATYEILAPTFVGLTSAAASGVDDSSGTIAMTTGVTPGAAQNGGTLTVTGPGTSTATPLKTLTLSTVVTDPTTGTTVTVEGLAVGNIGDAVGYTITLDAATAMGASGGTPLGNVATLTVSYNGVAKTYNVYVVGQS